MNSLFDDMDTKEILARKDEEKEVRPLDRLKDLDEKIANAIVKVKALKEENAVLDDKNKALHKRISELEAMLMEKDQELRGASSEKLVIKDQLQELLSELEAIELN